MAQPRPTYPAQAKGEGTRRVMELVGELHRLGLGRLRLACSVENAGPAPVWFLDVVPAEYVRADNGALLARPWREANQERAALNDSPNDAPMFTSRRFGPADYPWPGFVRGPLAECAAAWLRRYPALAARGRGLDAGYVGWYAAMLAATAPGLVAASVFWEAPPGHLYVSCGPVDRYPLPPPGEA